MNPRKTILDIATRELGQQETSRNRGPGLAKYWEATSYPNGMDNREPWCAAFVAWAVREAGRLDSRLVIGEKTRPRSAAVRNWANDAKRAGWTVFAPSQDDPEPGDVVVFDPQIMSHIGIVESFDGKGTITAIEGNTDDAGSREGVKVARKKRPLRLVSRFLRALVAG